MPTKTRFPFRYGIAAMTEAPHWFVRSRVVIGSSETMGIASEGLPPKWFTKNPETTFEEDDLPGMERVIRKAAKLAISIGSFPDFFLLWLSLKEEHSKWAEENGIPPLLGQFGPALIERSILDAFCRHHRLPLHDVVRRNLLGIRLGHLHSELADSRWSDFLPKAPLAKTSVRHTVGLADPLVDSDIADRDRIEDGLPHSLSGSIRCYGLTHFKIKLIGNLDRDRERLRDLHGLLRAEAMEGFKITVDGNEQYSDLAIFRDHFTELQADPEIGSLFAKHLLFVEQPIHRKLALEEGVRDSLQTWKNAPPLIIDESDAALESLPQALRLGYSGTSHKNCKGVLKSLLNRALIAKTSGGIMSGEDLANIGPVAVQQDLAVTALLGIDHVERNGHHYFAGLSMFSKNIQYAVMAKHSDLYNSETTDFPSFQIASGAIQMQSVNEAPFGVGISVSEFAGFFNRG